MRPIELPNTLQEIFDIAWERAKDQRKATDKVSGNCKYRVDAWDPTSLACFVGECIPDELYSKVSGDIEDKLVTSVIRLLKPDKSWDGFEDVLYMLQYIHDNREPHEWEGSLRELAKNHELTIPGESND